MTTKTLTGAYSAGYSLKSNYSRLVITASAKVYGFGVITTGAAAIANYGTVQSGDEYGVGLHNGSVTNGSATNKTALITGNEYGVAEFSPSPSGFVTNFATIQGGSYGVSGGSGIVTNGSAADTTALIAGGNGGVKIVGVQGGSTATATNFGTIAGSSNTQGGGVYLLGLGDVTNGSAADHAALIKGYVGVILDQSDAETVTNFGKIDGTSGTALDLRFAKDRLIVEAGSSLVGRVNGGGGTLELAGGSDTITGLGLKYELATLSGSASASFSGFGFYTVDAGTSLTLAGSNTFNAGGTLAVDGSATVTGPLTNLGVISSPNGAGVTLAAGGSVTNGSTSTTNASISGYHSGVDATGASATIGNFGAISSANGAGVTLAAGGSVTNGSAADTAASISGYLSGVDATGAAATIGNFGAISGASRYADGVELSPGGRVTNGSATDATASISGYFGVAATGSAGSAGVTVTNFGRISGTSFTSVSFTSAADRLIVEAGSALTGAASGAGGALELAGGSETITGLGGSGALSGGASASFYGFGSYFVDAGAILTLTGTNGLTTGQSLNVAGSLINTGSLQPTSRYDNGVDLNPGGRVTNGSATDATASISGYIGVSATGAAGSTGVTVTNFGRIAGTDQTSVGFTSASDRLIVEAGSAMTGSAVGAGGALELAGGSETITGLGSYDAMSGGASGSFYGFGSYLVDAGAVLTLTGTNSLATGQSLSVAGSLINTGSLEAAGRYGDGVDLSPGGRVTNGSAADSTASISGYIGVSATGLPGSAGVTVTNFGVIAGTDRTAVGFTSASDRLIVEAGSALTGAASGGGGTLEQAGGSDKITGLGGSGALSGGASGSFYSFGSYLVDAGAVLTLTGTNSLATGQSLTIAGSLINTGGLDNAGAPVTLSAGGKVTNGSASNITALIAGGVYASAASATITNFATLSGSGGAAVTLGNSTDLLNAEAGSTFLGAVDALAGGAVDVVSGPADFAGGVVARGKVEGGGLLLLSGGTSAFGAGASLSVATIDVTGAGTQVNVTTSLSDAKLWIQSAGTLSAGAGGLMHFTGSGDMFAGTLAGVGTVDFVSGSDTLNGTTLTVANVIIAAATVTLAGMIDNASNVSSSTANLIVAAGGASLTGVGTLTLSNSAANRIYGATSSATLTNVDNRIVGAGQLGAGDMTLINEAAGLINGNDSNALIIDTGSNTIVNDGFIEATGAGGVTIKSAVAGTGSVQVTAGTLSFASTFSQNVAFGAAGVLELADSETYTGSISGFSKTGHTSLDLLDIGFVSSSEATYSGTKTGGVLTVTDGTHTAKISLVGNYLTSNFIASSDGHGGTDVIDPKSNPGVGAVQMGAAHGFITAMAGLGDLAAHAPVQAGAALTPCEPTLANPCVADV
jgi:hypothetical protein